MAGYRDAKAHAEVNEADRMILWAEMDADNTGQVIKDEFEAVGGRSAGALHGTL